MPDVLCIQEYMLTKQTNFNLESYNRLFKEVHINYRAFGGVANLINETIPYRKLVLTTPLQTIAARVHIERDVTTVFIYISQADNICENLSSAHL